MKHYDKALHLVVGAALVSLFGALFGPWVGAGVCVLAAFGREAVNETGWSWADIAATLAGGSIALGAGLVGGM